VQVPQLPDEVSVRQARSGDSRGSLRHVHGLPGICPASTAILIVDPHRRSSQRRRGGHGSGPGPGRVRAARDRDQVPAGRDPGRAPAGRDPGRGRGEPGRAQASGEPGRAASEQVLGPGAAAPRRRARHAPSRWERRGSRWSPCDGRARVTHVAHQTRPDRSRGVAESVIAHYRCEL
jgi:hypothetical protein